MKKLFNICLIVFVLFSQLASFPYNQVKAETLAGNSLFDTVEMKDATNHIIDEALNPKNLIKVGSTIHLEYAWSIKDQQTDSAVLQIPNALKVKSDQQGNLMAEQQIIGQYFVKANDNKMKLVFNDQVKDSKGANGKISIDAVFNPDLKSGAKSVQLSFPLGATAKPISVPVQVDNPASPTADKDTAQQPAEEQKDGDAQQPAKEQKNGDTQQPAEEQKNGDAQQPTGEQKNDDAQQPTEEQKNGDAQQPTEEQKNGDAQQPTEEQKNGNAQQPTEEQKNGDNTTEQPVDNPDPSPKQITENILTGVTLTDKDGKPFNDTDNRPSPDSITKIDFTWEILESLNVKKGDYYTFQLPEYFIVHNTITEDLIDGKGHTIGSFVVTPDGKVTMTFNEYVEDHPNIAGDLNIRTEFNELKITGTTEKQIPFPIKEKDVIIELDFKPKVTKSIDKKGVPDRPINTNQINWKVEMNKTKDKLTNAVFEDDIPNGASLNEDSIKVYYLEVDINGKTTRGAEVPKEEYELTSSSNKLNIAFKKETNKAYEIEYATKITDESVTSFKNNAKVSSDNQGSVAANATVTVSRGTHLEKTSKYNPKTQTIEWTITYNGDQRDIKKADALLKDVLDKSHKVDKNSIVVKNASYDDAGKLVTGDNATNFTVKETDEGFDLQFNEDINSAYVITYTSKATNDVIKDGEIENKIIADGKWSQTNKVTLKQQNIIKKHNKKDTDYNKKTTTWTIIVNDNNYVLNDAVIKDTFDYGGLTLQKDSFKITDGSRTLDPNFDYTLDVTDTGFEVKLTGDYKSNMDKTLTITYTTDFNYETLSKVKENKGKNTSFKNTAKLTWVDINGDDKNSSSNDTFDPDGYTKGNGFKYGSYNAQTKEITWKIGFNYNNRTIKDPSIVDVLRDNQKLIPESIEVRHMKLTGGAHGFEVGDPVPPSEYTIEHPAKENNNTLTVHFKNEINSAYYISFKTSLVGEQINKRYDNYADLKDGSKTVTTIHGAFEIKNGGSGVTKTAKQNDKYIDWSVSINPSQSTIENAVVTDNPTDNQILDEKSFHLYPTTVAVDGTLTKDTTNELKEGTDYKLKVTTDNDTGKQQFKVEFLHTINRAYILEYRSLINADNNETVSNKVKITGNRLTLTQVETTEEKVVKVSSGSGGGSANKGRGSLQIIKVDDKDRKVPLAGAEFTLYDQTGTTAIRSITTGDDGVAKFNNLRRDKYLIKETKAPQGYVISKELKEGILVELGSEEITKYTLTNKKFVGKVVLTKTDATSRERLEHAVFSLLDQNKQVIPEHKELITNDKGQITVDHLKPGTYYLQETKAPEHYKLDDRLIEVKIAEDQTTVINRTATNSLIPGAAILTKVDKDGKTLAGAEFSVRDRNNIKVPGYEKLTTNDQGQIEAKDLRPGDYQFVEEKAPKDYDIDKKPIEFTIVKSQKKAVTVTATNHLIKGGVTLTKTDDIDGTALAGAVFKIVDANDEKKIIRKNVTTGADGKVTVKDLEPGTYRFIETEAPKDYVLNTNPIEFTIDKSQQSFATVTATNSLKTGEVELLKVDEFGDKKPLKGAVFKIVDVNNNDVRTDLTTNADGKTKADKLRPGTYKFIETAAPEHYVLRAEPIEFTIDRSQKETLLVKAENALKPGDVELTKVDDIDGTALAGAVFKIVDANDEKKVIRENIKTGADGKAIATGLRPGDYKFIEVTAPKYYDKNTSPIKFTITESQTTSATVTAKNSLTKGGIELTKVNAADEKETLEGAVFKIVNRDTNEDTRTNLVTNSEGKLVVDDLRPGNYKLIETKAPTYYDVNVEPIEFTIEKGQQKLLPLTFKNSLTKGKVKLIKEDDVESSIALAGAVFTLQDANGTEIAKDLKTDDHGVIVIPDLAPGDYQFIETSAPEHYKLDQTPIKFTIKKGSKDDLPVPVTVTNSLLTGGVTLTKVDDVDGATLEGAEFIIVDAHDTKKVVRKELTTDKQGKVSASDLRPGDYQFIEVKAPKDYTLANDPIPFTIGKSQKENITVTATNSLKKGAVTLTKIDDIDRTMLKGAIFKIVDMKGNEVRTNLGTDKNGKISVSDLRPGDYQFIETKAPEHYVLDETPIPFTIERSQTKEINVTGKNTLKKGSVELTKIDDIDTNTKLANAVFDLLDADGQLVEKGLKTNNEGKIVVENLRPGTYQFVETIAPEHYDLNKKPIKFTIKKSQTETLHVTAKNALTKGGVELSKVDDIDDTKLEGAVFNIVDMNGTVIHKDLVTNNKGKIEIDDLRPGDYQFIETKAPKHYVLDETPIHFTIEKGQKKAISLTAKNSLQQGSIELLKVDDLNDQMKLSDAVFNLLDQNGKVLKTDLKTNNEGKIVVENLRPGTYQFVETTAPKHYDLDKKPIVVTVEKSQKDIATVTMKNSLTKGGVELSKVDDVDGTTLEGAVFNIVDMKGTVIRKSLTTNSQGKISVPDLRPGDYQFIETKAPKHYDLNKEPIPFTIEKGQAEPISVTAKNSLTKGAVELSKMDDIDGTALEGAVFKIVDMNGNDVRTGITTDAKGKVSIPDLHPGDYQFIETKAPKHYKLDATPIKFTIEKSQAEKLQVTAKNSLIEGAVELIKVDDINPDTKLSDAVFNIIDAKGKIVRTNLTTDKDGKVSASNLRPGDYQFVETKAPKHYDLNKTPIPFTIEKSQTTHVSVTAKNGLTKGGVELTKVDSLDAKETLEGAVFKITDMNGNDIRTNLVTNKDGKIIAKDLQPGDYQFIETKAPKHYDLNEDPIKFTIERSQTKHVFVTATNSLTKGSVELIKVDDVEKNTTLEGAVFKIVNKDGHDVRTDLTTDKNGRLVVDELPPGDYEFIETKAPNHYDLNETPIKFTVKKGQEKIASVTAKNSLTKGAVELTKVDDIDGSTLEGAIFKIVDMNGNDVRSDLTTDKDGKISVSDLRPGDYQFIETKAPTHYDLNQTPINFTVEKSQTATASVIAKNSLTKGAVELTKVDDIDGVTLEGAVFKIVDMNGNDVRSDLTTNKDGKISVSDLRPGDYQFVETKAPDHYDLNQTPINFTVEKSQTATASVTATNSLTKGAVELSKVDDVDGTALKGAVFKIVDMNGNDVRADLTTDKDGKISVSDLRPGDYQFIETKAPTHYDLNQTPINFTVEKSQTTTASVTAKNSLTKGAVELTKVDDIDGSTLEGAIFKIVDMNGNDVRADLTTDKDGKISVSDLRPGDYQFIETKAPTGYDLNAKPIPFTITKGQSQVTSVTALNSLTTGSIELTKVDMDHNGTLEGAIFNILDQDGKVVREGLKTDGHGKLIINDLKPGNYQLVETKAPEGYQLDASPISFTIEKAQAAPLQITVSNKKIESSSGGDNESITPPNKEEKPGKETSEELEKGNPETQINKQQDDRNTGKELPNTGHKKDSTQTVGILLLLAGLLSILATKRKKYY
ncbi:MULTISPECIES: SpaA isopeptide-forming pilin-related protein [Bacillus cereus group]|uniref:LPXTG-motif cell wall anchor domain protein n=36 Tax=Bacillaceae TaxID=186817 RepID=B9IRZ0_BACCQ|nr:MULTISPECIES: SpaA isopeptide-forming pilin-related protein [Bacillus cereus group]ACM15598.1 LPXTG-motif cell wall anchor domain protein [Bacillus cereus Q1]MBY5228633.1 collagen-binding protein [Bacillus paranthracis]MDA1496924.1 SpaA isopeptide-forming pilin-related protein [Bacillus cereus group sp. TH41-1LC]MDA1693417.1 SpaA isopeptide-forming pilin-related protein [Bacillus cereus group sp. m1-2]MDA1698472.1 SpaA isopeptide-forming pilin-related protein [Bacillus cereus group sp. m1-1